MLHAFRSEWIKLRRLLVLAGGAAMILFTVAPAAVVISRAVAHPSKPDQVSIAALSSDTGLTFLLNRSAVILPVIALILVASNVGAEYSQGTLRNLLVREPGRLRLMAGKFLALLVFIFLNAAVAVGLGIAVAFALAPGHGVDTTAWTSSTALSHLWTFLGNIALAIIGYSVYGLVVALLFRSAAAAVGVCFAWFGIAENLLVLAYNDLAKFLPGELISAVRAGGVTQPVEVGYGYALVGAGIWVVGALIAGAALLRMRDLTS